MSLSLPQRFGLWKWLSEELAALRKDDLLPQAGKEMPAGARIPVMFGEKLAGWVTMPQPSKVSAAVMDEGRLLRWAKASYPGKVEYPVEVKVDAGLIEYLQEHRPESLHTGERVDPQWVADICAGLSGKDGYYVTATGEKLTEVPGIEIPERKPSVPRVDLEDCAAAVIQEARAAGEIDLGEMLALPAGDAPDAS
jgi:hypothetical protein